MSSGTFIIAGMDTLDADDTGEDDDTEDEDDRNKDGDGEDCREGFGVVDEDDVDFVAIIAVNVVVIQVAMRNILSSHGSGLI